MSTLGRDWLGANPYLAGIARFQAIVEEALARAPDRLARVERWEAWRAEAEAGVPILRSRSAGVDFAPAAAATLGDLVEALAGAPVPERVAASLHEVREHLLLQRGGRDRAIAWIAAGAGADGAPENAGLVKLLAWTAARRVLAPISREAGQQVERWGRGHCPTCGALPAMAQLVEGEGGRPRLLACGCCGTRWRHRRIGCPYCDSEAPDSLGILEVEGDVPLRLDVCRECMGYLKVYTAEGDEETFLADWPTLHLDLAAANHGFRRLGSSLYDLPHDERRN